MSENDRVLVAGACGFLGSHFVDRCLSEGYSVVAFDDLSSGSKNNLEQPDRINLVVGDVTDAESVRVAASHGPYSFVVNFASPASPVRYSVEPLKTLRVNSRGTDLLLSIAVSCGATFLQASTSEVYGDPQQHPQSEGYFGNVDTIGPRSCYDESKRFSEALVAAHRSRIPIRIARIFNTYGPRMDPFDGRVVSTFVRQALEGEPITVQGDGRQTRSFCYVSDMIEGLFRLMTSDYDQPINLGNPDERSIMELARMVAKRCESNSRIEHIDAAPGDPKVRMPDIERARRHLDWVPDVALEQGLDQTIEWMRVRLRSSVGGSQSGRNPMTL